MLVLDSPDSVALVMTELKQLGVIIEGTYDEFVDIAIPLPLIEKAAKSEKPGQIFKQLSTTKHVIKIRLPIIPRSDAIGLLSEGVGTTGAETWQSRVFRQRG